MKPVPIEPVKSQRDQLPYGGEIQIPGFCFFFIWVSNFGM